MKKNTPYFCNCPPSSCPHLDEARARMIAAGVPDMFSLLESMQPPVGDPNLAEEPERESHSR
jgi:hypothetical protein